jgi:hypothetical protein
MWSSIDPLGQNANGDTTAKGGGVTVKVQKTLEVEGGTFIYKIEPLPSKDGADMTIEFVPNCDTCNWCDKIAFIQFIASTTIGGKPNNVKGSENFISRPDLGQKLDVIPGDEDPFYGAKWDKDQKEWVDEAGASRVGGCDSSGSSTNAWIGDRPWRDNARTGRGDVVWKARTCAVCISTGEVYGCITLGWSIEDRKDSPVKVWSSDTAIGIVPADLASLEVWNDFATLNGHHTFEVTGGIY